MIDIPKTKGMILIVDDEPDVLFFISRVCRPMGYDTLTAGSGMEALKIIEECGEKIDLILLDLKMPGMGGIEVLRSIRKRHEKLPVIILTAVRDAEQGCLNLGVEAFIKKPYSLEELYNRIEVIIERRIEDKGGVEIDPGWELCAKILIVDDEDDLCEYLAEALVQDVADAHFEVKWVKSGDEALRISREFEPDIGIIDIKMPHMWGDELINRFKAGEGHSPKDFIIHTAVDQHEELSRIKKLGYRCITKPTHLEILVEALKKICIKHKLLRKKA